MAEWWWQQQQQHRRRLLLRLPALMLGILTFAVVWMILNEQSFPALLGQSSCTTSSSSPSSLQSSSSTASTTSNDNSILPILYQEDLAYCETHNLVRNRDKGPTQQQEQRSEQRPHSISHWTFAAATSVLPCTTLNDALAAIKYGQRHWNNTASQYESLPPSDREDYPSHFVPHGCDLPLLTASQLCETLGHRFQHVIFHGDSLTRHVRQGLLMALRQDLVLGGIESSNKHTHNTPYTCRCDGQFSEHSECRKNNRFFDNMTPRDLGLCSHLAEEDQFRIVGGEPPWEEMECRRTNDTNAVSTSYKGALLVLQGGVHHRTNATTTLHTVVDPILQHPKFHDCHRAGKLTVLWTSYNAQSRRLDVARPLQTRELAVDFNRAMEVGLRERFGGSTSPRNGSTAAAASSSARSRGGGVTIIDWWNLTKDAQTSDGFHYLSDVNFVKAHQLAHVVSFL